MYTANEKIANRDIGDEMKESFTTYAMSVIIQRALPDARDGLKPSQRRILYAMRDLNLAPNRKHRKCAKIAGDTSGNYHPHGEGVVYPTLVRMAQDFSMRYTLIDGQGNFGSIDGDPPAAMRYTEARLTHEAMSMMEDLDKETVDFVPNYEETRMEPVVLPSMFPNLLCNGSSGIAVGMATNIPPHNLGEVVEALILLIDNPDVTIEDIIKVLPGPDFPTGGLINGRDGIREAYKTGKGHITCQARAGIEPGKNGKDYIIITEIPYMVNKSNLIESIARLVNDKVINGIADLRDESDKDGMRIVVELKRGEIPRVVLNQLYKHTEMQKTFGAIMLALTDGIEPKIMNIKEMLNEYVKHRINVVVRRTQYELNKAEERAHILEGFKIALKNLDEVVKIIRTSKDREEAKVKLIAKFKFSDRQADAILEMRLYQLTGLERDKIEAEYKELLKKISYYKSVLASEKMVRDIIKEELRNLKEKYSDERRTDIVAATGELEVEDLIANEGCIITISHDGYIKRVPVGTYRSQRRGGKGVTGMDTKEEDFVQHLFTASTHDYLLFFTTQGKCYWLKVYEIPTGSRTSRGKAIVNLLDISAEEKIADLIRVKEFTQGSGVLMVTQNGTIKKTDLSAFSNPRRSGIIAINIEEGDQLRGVKLTSGKDEILLVTRQGQSIRFDEKDVRFMGRSAAGVKGITLKKENDAVVGVEVINDRATLLIVCENGYGKRTAYSEYRLQKRGGKGIIAIKTSERNGMVVQALNVNDNDDIVITTANGVTIRMAVNEIRTIGRATQGVRIINLEKDEKGNIKDRVVDVARMISEKEEDEAGEELASQEVDTVPPPAPRKAKKKDEEIAEEEVAEQEELDEDEESSDEE